MSPATLNNQVAQLATELAKCIRMCEDIRVNRHIGSTHENLDKLQLALENAETAIPANYKSSREYVGVELDIGDGMPLSPSNRFEAPLTSARQSEKRDGSSHSRSPN